MYEAFFGLREKPFTILPDPNLIYWGQNHRLALAMLQFGVMNNAGFTVITGEIGSGKTTLLRYMLRQLDPNIIVGLMSSTPQGHAGLLQWVMMALDQPFEGSYPQLFKAFQQFLRDQYALGRRTILIADEAQNLGLPELEELRMLSNINADKDQLLQIVLVGQPQLRDMLRTPQLVQFAQRVSSDFHLKPLTAEEVDRYISFRLAAVGGQENLFDVEASQMIAQASRGIPRTINVLCDTAMVYAFATGSKAVTTDIVSLVIQDKRDFGVFGSVAAETN